MVPDEPQPGGAVLRAICDLAVRASADRDEAIAMERRLCALEAGLAAEAREREGVWAGARRLVEDLDGRLRKALEVREREADRRRGWVRWAADKFLVPFVCAAAGALAARKGWLP